MINSHLKWNHSAFQTIKPPVQEVSQKLPVLYVIIPLYERTAYGEESTGMKFWTGHPQFTYQSSKSTTNFQHLRTAGFGLK